MINSQQLFGNKSTPGYWIRRLDKKPRMQYAKIFENVKWQELVKLARKIDENVPIWSEKFVPNSKSVMEEILDTGTIAGIPFVSFPIIDPYGKKLIVIESRVHFESIVGPLEHLVKKNPIQDGQHQHKGKK